MPIESIDKNFVISREKDDSLIEYVIPKEPFKLYGVSYDEADKAFYRIKSETAMKISEGVSALSRHTAGGRLRFSTDSDRLEISVTYNSLTKFPHMPLSGTGGFILLEEDDSSAKLVAGFFPTHTDDNGYRGSVSLCGEMKNYILYFPLYNDVKSLSIFLSRNASVGSGKEYRHIEPILYAGSSITQGGCASRADTCYQGIISRWNNIDYINLGFSGGFKAEDAMADHLAEQKCSIFVYDYDYNAPTIEHLEKTHYRLYETFRKKQKSTPIIMISRPNGQSSVGRKAAAVIKASYLKARENGDSNVFFIDGGDFYGKDDYEFCSVDGIHPTDLGFYKMAKLIYKVMIDIDEKFK